MKGKRVPNSWQAGNSSVVWWAQEVREMLKKTAHNMNEGREERWSQVRQIKQGRSLGPGRRQGEGEAYLSQQVLV